MLVVESNQVASNDETSIETQEGETLPWVGKCNQNPVIVEESDKLTCPLH